jgi:hypothetical protein
MSKIVHQLRSPAEVIVKRGVVLVEAVVRV